MFYECVYPLHELPGLSALNVFRYITFRAAYAAITALLLCFVLGPPMIEWLRRVKLGQKIRAEGPQSHLTKAGTPTMGGLLIVTAIVVPTLLWGNLHSRPLWLALLATVWLGAHRLPRRLPARGEGLSRRGCSAATSWSGSSCSALAIGLVLLTWPERGAAADRDPRAVPQVPASSTSAACSCRS